MKFLADIKNMSWSVEGEPSYEHIVCEIGFRNDDALPVTFSFPLEFGLRVSSGEDSVVQEISFPRFGEEYVYTDQDYVHAENIFGLESDTEYKIDVWARYGEDNFSGEFLVRTFRYPQPYPTWTYNEVLKKWEPPFPPPQDGYSYKWASDYEVWVRSLGYNEEAQAMEYSIYDEQLQDWVPYEFPKVDE